MFITMYFAIHLKLKDDQHKKTYIKQLMSEIILRIQCIEMFESKFHDLYNSPYSITQ